jgi:hypothetical protein
MYFGLSSELSRDILCKAPIIKEISDNIVSFFEGKSFGAGIQTLTIGILCVSAEFEFFFKVRKKYSKQKKLCEYDIKIDYSTLKKADSQESKLIVLDQISKSFGVMDELFIPNFDIEQFKKTFESFVKDSKQ